MLEIIYSTYPELINQDLRALGIWLQDDTDGQGVWLRHWEYSKPLPDGLTLGKPTA